MKKISQYISEQIYLFFYIILIGTGLVVAIITLSNTVSQSSARQDGSSTEILEIDQSKIDRIGNLQTSDNTNALPAATPGRTNPFSE